MIGDWFFVFFKVKKLLEWIDGWIEYFLFGKDVFLIWEIELLFELRILYKKESFVDLSKKLYTRFGVDTQVDVF